MTDLRILFVSRGLRMFAFGMLAVILALFLEKSGLSKTDIGLLFSLTMIGDTAISLFLTTKADRFGRRKTLMIGACLMLGASVVFAFSSVFFVLALAATLGVLSPSGNEVGPFLPVEQAALSEELGSERRVAVIAWYNVVGYFATAFGALSGGFLSHALQGAGWSQIGSFRAIIVLHGVLGFALLGAYAFLSSAAESKPADSSASSEARILWLGLHKSKKTVLRLSALFSVDAFAGGFIMQSLIAYWFHLRWGASEEQLGTMLFFGNLFAGVSSLLAVRIARRFGLLNTMVWTHIPSNVLLVLVPLMPTFQLSLGVLLLRFCLSQMDVPTRQAYVMAVVDPDERSAAGGVTNVARSVGTSVAPAFTGALFAVPALGLPFIVAGGLKIAYDLTLWRVASQTKID